MKNVELAIHECYEYRSDGELVWVDRRPDNHFASPDRARAWHTMCSGKIATSDKKNGYRTVFFNGKNRLAHRIIWEMHYGPIPDEKEIDHINGVRSDNRIENLRLATGSQNQHNTTKTKANKSGYKGVSWSTQAEAWRADIWLHRKQYPLGFFKCPTAAHIAYVAAAKRMHGEFARFD